MQNGCIYLGIPVMSELSTIGSSSSSSSSDRGSGSEDSQNDQIGQGTWPGIKKNTTESGGY